MVTEYPAGLIPLCLLLGAGYAALLYYLDLKRGQRRALILAMTGLRFLSVSLIAFLILSPMIRQNRKLVEKPLVMIGMDNSRSVALTSDSGYYRNTLPGKIMQLAGALGKKCEVRFFSFDDHLYDGLRTDYSGAKTNISLFFDEVNTRYCNRNAAAIVLASDGLYNEGADPFYASRKITFPVYTIALGDTGLKKDLCIRKVLVNKTAFRGDKFPVEVLVEMNKCSGLKSRLSVSQGSHVIETRDVRAGSDHHMQKVTFMLDARETGMTRYSLQLDELEGETSRQNNRADFLVDIRDARQKIALVTASPHPDITAIREALQGSSHFELEMTSVEELRNSAGKYDLVILNQLPSVTNITDPAVLMKPNTSLLFIIGSLTDLNAFNRLNTGLVITSSKNMFSDAQPSPRPDFSLFSMNGKDLSVFREFPPLQAPFGTYQYSPLTDVLFGQKIGNTDSRIPLVMFTHTPERKIGIIAGENIWRWRISNFVQQSNHECFDTWIDKVIQYLATKEDKSFFRIHVSNRISENEPVEMDAELYNDSYELINKPDVNITITDHDNKSYPFIFSRTLKSYYLNAGRFPAGEYTYNATVANGNRRFQKSGKLFIEKVDVEYTSLQADHNLLYRISAAHNGVMMTPAGIDSLAAKILANGDVRSVAVYQNRMSDLIGNPWLFALIILLVTAEWVLRKREGM